MNAKEYWTEFAKTTGLPEDQVKAVELAFGNEKVANAFVPRPEYSRSLDEERGKYNDLVKKNSEYYQTEASRAAENQKIVEQAKATAQRYRDTYGDLDGGDPNLVKSPTFDASKYVPKEELTKALETQGSQFVNILEHGLTAVADYQYRFGKPLNVPELKKFAIERNLPLDQAYQKFIEPEVQAKTNTEFEAKLKAEYERGAQEARSRVKLPIDNSPRETTPLLNNLAAARDKASVKSEGDRVSSFAEAWSKGNNAT